MSNFLKKLIRFFSIKDSGGLDAYIASNRPTSVSDIERLTVQYLTQGKSL